MLVDDEAVVVQGVNSGEVGVEDERVVDSVAVLKWNAGVLGEKQWHQVCTIQMRAYKGGKTWVRPRT
jgi:hypothetical protein